MRTPTQPKALADLSLGKRDLLECFRLMALSRSLDRAEDRLVRQQKAYFAISGSGHEAVQVAIARLLRPGKDWFFPYYRDRAFCLALGVSPRDMLLQAMGRRNDSSSGGRLMPSHWGNPALHIVNQSSPTGTQFLHAVGVAEAARILRQLPLPLDDRPRSEADEIVYVSSGEGATSEGEFYEAVSAAVLNRLPVLFLVQDNQYAISVPVEQQTPFGSISRFLGGVPGLDVLELEGLEPERCHRELSRVVARLRAGHGPALVHAHVLRLSPHSNSDEHRDYRPARELDEEARDDPIAALEHKLFVEGWASQDEIDAIRASIQEQVADAIRDAEASPLPDPARVQEHLFAPAAGPIVELLIAPAAAASPAVPAHPDGSARPDGAGGRALTWSLLEAVRNTLAAEMRRDPRVVVFGQDVADAGRVEALEAVAAGELPGKGGVFKATLGLQQEFGSARVFNAPIAEASLVGRAIGMAVRGLRPVVEIQFFDYIWPAMMQIRNELSVLRWRSCGAFQAPVVIRAPIGGYLRGGAVYHSQTGESIFCRCPGLRVVMPSCARDAVGLLRSAIRCDDPVLFLEHKHLYRQLYARSEDPGSEFVVPFGKAVQARAGRDVTVVTYGAAVRRSLLAADAMARRGVEVEVIDLRSLQPYDFAAIAESVRRTSRLVVASEEPREFGVSAEIAARAAEELFYDLDAPVLCAGSLPIPVAYSPVLEEATLLQVEDIVARLDEVLGY